MLNDCTAPDCSAPIWGAAPAELETQPNWRTSEYPADQATVSRVGRPAALPLIRPLLAMTLIATLCVAKSGRCDQLANLRELPCRIVFEAYDDSNWDLWTIGADGSERTNLTATPDIHELYPQVSPDGEKIAFLVDQPEGRDTLRSLWVMKSDGSDRRKIADGTRHMCWSPDGRRLAFPQQEFRRFQIRDFASKRLAIHDLETGVTEVHPNDKIEHIYVPTWSADGEWIISTVHAGMGYGHAIVAIEVAGDRVVDLKIEGCRPCLSSDGQRLTWSRDDHTVTVADVQMTEGGPLLTNERVLYHHDTMHLYHPDFSPDGQFVSFSLGPGGRMPAAGPGTHTEVAEMVGVRGNWDIYVKAVDGTESPFQVTHQAELSNKESDWLCAP